MRPTKASIGGIFFRRAFKISEDWTVGSRIARAAFSQMLKRRRHFLHFRDALAKVGNAGERDPLDVAALPGSVTPELKQLVDLCDGKTEVARTTNEAKHVDVVNSVIAITAFSAARRGDETDLLVIADHFGADARAACCLTDVLRGTSRSLWSSAESSPLIAAGRKFRRLILGNCIPRNPALAL